MEYKARMKLTLPMSPEFEQGSCKHAKERTYLSNGSEATHKEDDVRDDKEDAQNSRILAKSEFVPKLHVRCLLLPI